MRIVLTSPGGATQISRTYRSFLDDGPVITTRFDSDDAIHRRYVEAIQSHADEFLASEHEAWVLNFPRGYQLDHATGHLYFHWTPRSYFHSRFERDARTAGTILGVNAKALYETHPSGQDDSLAAWVQVVHGGNVINKLRKGWVPMADPVRLADFGIDHQRPPNASH